MRRFLLIIFLQICISDLYSQSFSVSDLIKASLLPAKNVEHFMNKSGYVLNNNRPGIQSMDVLFSAKPKKNYIGPERTIDINLNDESKNFILQTTSLNEYLDGQRSLVASEFFYDTTKKIGKDSSIFFQKGNITVTTNVEIKDSNTLYTFSLLQRKIPSAVKFAEDLLQFDSHEMLVSFFGAQNVKKDMFYFAEKELRKCSVLFSGTRYQVVFVWKDESNLNNILYILVPHILRTKGADQTNPVAGSNEWQFKNGIYPGMELKELLRLNETDFSIYGNNSEFAYMVKPDENAKIDFKKTAVTLSCNNCDDIKMFKQKEVSALDVVKRDLPMYVTDVVIYPPHN